jgi:hypothetical protein
MDGPPMTSPYVQQFQDNFGKFISITVNFNNTTRALSGATVFRDATCQWTHIYIGLGADGTPDTTDKAFTVPAGTSSVSAQQLRQRGLNTIEDVLALQITAGP